MKTSRLKISLSPSGAEILAHCNLDNIDFQVKTLMEE